MCACVYIAVPTVYTPLADASSRRPWLITRSRLCGKRKYKTITIIVKSHRHLSKMHHNRCGGRRVYDNRFHSFRFYLSFCRRGRLLITYIIIIFIICACTFKCICFIYHLSLYNHHILNSYCNMIIFHKYLDINYLIKEF